MGSILYVDVQEETVTEVYVSFVQQVDERITIN